MQCSKCKKILEETKFFTLAKTHNKYLLVQGVMKGSYINDNLVYCEACAKTIDLNTLHF